MSNKTQLQANNETLASILSNVLGLPSQESLKHGAYVWKKYNVGDYVEKTSLRNSNLVITTEPQNQEIRYHFSTSYTFDESTGQFTLGDGAYSDLSYGSSSVLSNKTLYYMIGTRTDTKMYSASEITTNYPTLYNTSDGVYIGLTKGSSNPLKIYEGVKEIGAADFVDFVVSDSPTAYPDGGEQGGYWYEKVVEGKTGIDYGEISIVDSALQKLTINHNLGVVPSIAVVYPKNATIYRNETKAFFGSFGAKLTAISTPFISPIWSCNITNYNPYLSNSVGDGAYGSSTATADTIIIIPASYWVTGTYIWFAIA